jgi:hypothetical protein
MDEEWPQEWLADAELEKRNSQADTSNRRHKGIFDCVAGLCYVLYWIICSKWFQIHKITSLEEVLY